MAIMSGAKQKRRTAFYVVLYLSSARNYNPSTPILLSYFVMDKTTLRERTRELEVGLCHLLVGGHKRADEGRHQSAAYLTDVFRHQPDRRPHLARNTDTEFGIKISLLVCPTSRDQIVVHIAALHAIEHIQEENAGTDGRVLE
jgi:hypothetical protein